MSAWETVPTDTDKDWLLMTEAEREEYLRDAFADLQRHQQAANAHNQDGYFAESAGSPQCEALGHTEADYENDLSHPPSWDGEPLCIATKFGTCCTECEGECNYEIVPSLWSLPGVLAV